MKGPYRTFRTTQRSGGASEESPSQSASGGKSDLSQLRTDATAAGILVALGVLAMTVCLIRSETAQPASPRCDRGERHHPSRPDGRPRAARGPARDRQALDDP
jgi:hypothetical protein